MTFLPHFPLHFNATALFGITLLLGLIGGELAKRIPFIPTISGYIAIGYLVGSGGLNLVNDDVFSTARIFVEISLSLIMFELGRYLDFRWLWRDRGLFGMSLAESSITFIAILTASHYFFALPWLQSALASTIAVATSPAVVMMVAHDISAEGPVTRRMFILTSLNNLFALTLFAFLVPFAQPALTGLTDKLLYSLYQLLGSFFLGMTSFMLSLGVAYLTKKIKENQFILFVGIVVFTASFARMLNLSPMLALFTLGAAARNFDFKHFLMEIDFAWLARLFYIVLFVVVGVTLQLHNLRQFIGIVVAFIVIRGLAKALGICMFAKPCQLTLKQTMAISLSLLPMAGIAISLAVTLMDFNPELSYRLLSIIAGVVALLNIIGPIAVQFALTKTDEALVENR